MMRNPILLFSIKESNTKVYLIGELAFYIYIYIYNLFKAMHGTLQSFLFGEDLWRWPSLNCIKMNQPFWVFLCSSDYLLPVCLPHHSKQQIVKMKWCNKSRRLKDLHERKTLKSWPISGVGKFFEASSFANAQHLYLFTKEPNCFSL